MENKQVTQKDNELPNPTQKDNEPSNTTTQKEIELTAQESLNKLRIEIDQIDGFIVQFLEKRMRLVQGIADIKAESGVSVLDSDRERKVLKNVDDHVLNKDYQSYMQEVFKSVMAHSRAYQKKQIDGKRPHQTIQEDLTKQKRNFGLLGAKLSHSLSPTIHQEFFRIHDIAGEYQLIEKNPEELPHLFEDLRKQCFRGINITIPYKKDIMPLLDEISKEALRIGAVNTVTIGEKLIGYNTDYEGFGYTIRENFKQVEGIKAAVVGTGGASRAVVSWLEDQGADRITLVTRDPDEAVMRFPGLHAVKTSDFHAKGYDLLVNTSPVGMFPLVEASPLEKEQIKGVGFIFDLIYNPEETLLMKYAKSLGIPSENGLKMLVVQALHAEMIWNGFQLESSELAQIVEKVQSLLKKELI
jgi:shikimate dehydrogenase